MAVSPGDTLTLEVERPAVGGRMIARHDGAVVLVAGAIPGERVVAAVERVQRHTVFARTVDVLEPSPDRVAADPALACGGNVLAHVSAPRQAALKGEMLTDAFRRLARTDVGRVPVVAGPADGYRTRARAHVRRGRWGFFEASTHALCAIAGTRQLSADGAARLEAICAAVAGATPHAAEVEWAESLDGARFAAHVDVAGRVPRGGIGTRSDVQGLSWSGDGRESREGFGEPFVVDTLRGADGREVTIRHHVRSFFQGNRYLLQVLVDDVAGRVDADAAADLYAGVGLFSVRLAADGRTVAAVEADRYAAGDLAAHARDWPALVAHHATVEAFVAAGGLDAVPVVVVDPPRTGLAPAVAAAVARSAARRIVYVSCDPATLARDVGLLIADGFALADLRAFDLFPRTAHVEAVATLERPAR
ncbi:MAG: class I SAM-dependent RNA methyltransferase [Vicinamibacterales bacterium]